MIKKVTNKPVSGNVYKDLVLPFIISFSVVFMGFYLINLKAKSPAKTNTKKKLLTDTRKAPVNRFVDALQIVNNAYMNPVTLLSILDNDPSEIVLADTRGKEAYKKSHIKGAVNISITDTDNADFKNKKIVLYGETAYDAVPRNIAIKLAKKNYDVRILSIGWNEFRHFRNLWLPESMWDGFDVLKYINISE